MPIIIPTSANLWLRCLCSVLLAYFVSTAKGQADVTLAGMFSDNCVLQRDMPLPIWGWGDPQEQVTVELAGIKETVQAAPDGRWQVVFKPFSAGGPYTLNVTGKNSLQVKNILIGEVWIGVGQSNMMFGVSSSTGGNEALLDLAKYPLLRMAHERAIRSPQPQTKVKMVHWGPPNVGSSAVSFYFAEQLYDYFKGKVPVGILNFTEIVPAQAYCDPELIKADPKVAGFYGAPFASELFNGMVKPVSPFSIRGILYYQGEMNAGGTGSNSGPQFRALMSVLIESWRKAWGNESLPFLFVQLPAYQENMAPKDKRLDMDPASLSKILGPGRLHGFVGIREAQLQILQTIPHTGMAVTIDVGEQWNIHPHNKKTVGERLFLQARHVAYNDDSVVFSGPMALNVEFKDSQAIATFDYIGSNLVAHGNKLEGFELAGPDQILYPAAARIDGNKVIVSSDQVKDPVMLHYAWAGYPAANLFNAEGLPASPFRWYRFDKLPMADRGEFTIPNSDFATQDGWDFADGAELEKSPDGSNAVLLPKAGAKIQQTLQKPFPPMTGFNFNSSPILSPLCVRPGDLLGYSVEMAAAPGDGVADGYYRIVTQGGLPAYLDCPSIKASSDKFTPRHVVLQIPPNTNGGNADFMSIANIARANIPNPRPFFVRNLSPIKLLRPLLGISNSDRIDLGNVVIGGTAESKPIVISNDQKDTLTMQISELPDAASQTIPTILYGLADIKPDAREYRQSVHDLANDVGAVLIGTNASDFELNSPHATEDKHGVRLLGQDGKPGLTGGVSPETESLTVRFHGSNHPGTYQATLRIVTQAGNIGCLSQGKPNEPPINLYYTDIPVTVNVL